MKGNIGICVGLLFMVMNSALHAADTDDPGLKTKNEELKELAMDVQNPVSDLWRFGFTHNAVFGTGPTNSTINNVNLFANTTRQFGQWSIINRLVVPLLYLPESMPDAPSGDSGRSFGLGDIEWTGFLARDESKRWFKSIGGLGPTVIFKTATDDRMGQGKWTIGPTLVIASMMPDPWVNGVLVRNLWSFGGDSDRPKVNLFVLQPFVNYNFSGGWYLSSTPLIKADWEADRRDRWTVPLGGGIGKVLFRGERHPINVRLQSFYFIEKPDSGPDWSLQVNFRMLFPEY